MSKDDIQSNNYLSTSCGKNVDKHFVSHKFSQFLSLKRAKICKDEIEGKNYFTTRCGKNVAKRFMFNKFPVKSGQSAKM